MNVLLDIMSGEASPTEVIQGAVDALQTEDCSDISLVLLGDEDLARKLFQRAGGNLDRVEIIDAPEKIPMHATPVDAVKNHPQSSLVKGCEELKSRDGVFISPGNTGAVVAASLLKLGRISGIARPGLAAILPTLEGKNVILIDVGATIDATPNNLAQYAAMGDVLNRHALERDSSKIGLLNIGEEKGKGNQLTKETSSKLSASDFNYVGNIEPHHLLMEPAAEVVVCEGFVGNVLLKAFEGGSSGAIKFFENALSNSLRAKLGAFLLRPTLSKLKKQLSFSRFGAVPLLGVKGTIFVGHGRSKATAIRNAIINAQRALTWDLPNNIHNEIERMNLLD